MPFLKLTSTHKCDIPKVRDDGSALQYGDTWYCDDMISERNSYGTVSQACGKTYEWRLDQRDGDYWMRVGRQVV